MEHTRRTYTVNSGDILFDDIYYLLITISSMLIASSYKLYGSSQFAPPLNDDVWFDGKATNRTYGFPINRAIDNAIKDEKPSYIQLFTYEITEDKLLNRPTGLHIDYLYKPFSNVFSSYFISYYEKKFTKAKSIFDNKFSVTLDKNKAKSKFNRWPNSWRMGWLVRNALVHNGRIYYNEDNMKTPPPTVIWYNASVSTNNQDDQLLGNIFSYADLLILILEMDEELA